MSLFFVSIYGSLTVSIWSRFTTVLVVGVVTFYTSLSNADGGIGLGATRLIYGIDQKQASMLVINSTAERRYLINAWVEDASAKENLSIVVTPPIFVSEPKSESSLRIVNTDVDLPSDRETLYYLSVQAIPAVDKAQLAENDVLQLAILSRIKMMMRPKNLKIKIEQAPELIEVSKSGENITFNNPTPYYMTLINIMVDGKKEESVMLDPFSTKSVKSHGKTVSFQTINDFGAFTGEIVKTF